MQVICTCVLWYTLQIAVHFRSQQEGTAKYATGTMDKKKNRISGVRFE